MVSMTNPISYSKEAVYRRVLKYAQDVYGDKVKPLGWGRSDEERFEEGFSLSAIGDEGVEASLTLRLEEEIMPMQVPFSLIDRNTIRYYEDYPTSYIWHTKEFMLSMDITNIDSFILPFRLFSEEREKLIICLLGHVIPPS